ncbi:MAG TPA: translation elongation factor-like protein [Candidatus Bathyarchaeia archaeon]|nr:translation elongation factor-like protein [Candidatus Bathyarchaeia archaeon]
MADFKVGKINHYYNKIGVAVIEVLAPIAIGDKIKISGSNEFEQVIASLQVEHEQIQQAEKGAVVGLKVDQPVKEGDAIIKISG